MIDHFYGSPAFNIIINGYVLNLQRTPLHLAVIGGYEELVQLLLQSGASVDARDDVRYCYNIQL